MSTKKYNIIDENDYCYFILKGNKIIIDKDKIDEINKKQCIDRDKVTWKFDKNNLIYTKTKNGPKYLYEILTKKTIKKNIFENKNGNIFDYRLENISIKEKIKKYEKKTVYEYNKKIKRKTDHDIIKILEEQNKYYFDDIKKIYPDALNIDNSCDIIDGKERTTNLTFVVTLKDKTIFLIKVGHEYREVDEEIFMKILNGELKYEKNIDYDNLPKYIYYEKNKKNNSKGQEYYEEFFLIKEHDTNLKIESVKSPEIPIDEKYRWIIEKYQDIKDFRSKNNGEYINETKLPKYFDLCDHFVNTMGINVKIIRFKYNIDNINISCETVYNKNKTLEENFEVLKQKLYKDHSKHKDLFDSLLKK